MPPRAVAYRDFFAKAGFKDYYEVLRVIWNQVALRRFLDPGVREPAELGRHGVHRLRQSACDGRRDEWFRDVQAAALAERGAVRPPPPHRWSRTSSSPAGERVPVPIESRVVALLHALLRGADGTDLAGGHSWETGGAESSGYGAIAAAGDCPAVHRRRLRSREGRTRRRARSSRCSGKRAAS